MVMDLLKKNKAGLPSEARNSFCRRCHSIWIPEKTVVITFDRKNSCLRVLCKRCGNSKRL